MNAAAVFDPYGTHVISNKCPLVLFIVHVIYRTITITAR